jgi:hypothetical protein
MIQTVITFPRDASSPCLVDRSDDTLLMLATIDN